MQAILETAFDIVYLVLVITLGIRMIRGNAGRRQYLLFGIMAVTGEFSLKIILSVSVLG